MKTLKFVLLCFMVVFAIGPVKAQNPVIKEDVILYICGESQKVPCTGDYLCGSATFQFMFMKKNWIIKGKDSDVKKLNGKSMRGHFVKLINRKEPEIQSPF